MVREFGAEKWILPNISHDEIVTMGEGGSALLLSSMGVTLA